MNGSVELGTSRETEDLFTFFPGYAEVGATIFGELMFSQKPMILGRGSFPEFLAS